MVMMLMDASYSRYTNDMKRVEAELAIAMVNVAQKRQEYNETQFQLDRVKARFLHLFA